VKRSTVLVAGSVLVLLGSIAGVVLLREDPRTRTPGAGASGPRGGGQSGTTTVTPGESPTTSRSPGEKSLATPLAPSIGGVVRDVRGAPVAGARVSLLATPGDGATTGAEGAFALTLPAEAAKDPARRHVLLAEGPAPLAARVVPGVLAGSSVVIVLRPGEATVEGRVVRARDRSPVAGARIESSLGDWLGRATTDAAGRFVLAATPAGALGLVVSAEGLIPRVTSIVAARGGGAPREIALEAGVRVSGLVQSQGRPVANATVLLREGGVPVAFERRQASSDSRGRFAFEAFPATEGFLVARSPGGISPRVTVRADGVSAIEEVVLELGPGVAIAGRVSSDGSPVAGAELGLEDRDGGGTLLATSDAQGRFRLEPVAQGASGLALHAAAPGFATRRLRVAAGADLEVALARAARLTVSAPDVPGLVVEALAAGERRVLAETTHTDARVVLGVDDLSPGPCFVVARAPGRAIVSREVELAPEGTTRVELELPGGLALEGRCQGDDGAAVVGAAIVATDPASGPLTASATATTDVDGRFRLEGLGATTYRVIGSAPSYLEARAEAAPGANLTLELPRAYALSVNVSVPVDAVPEDPDHADGHAARGRVLVRLSPQDAGTPEERVVDARGGQAQALFDRVRGGRYTLLVLAPGLAPLTGEVDPRSRSSVDVVLARGARVSGVVLGADGSPLPGAAIRRGRDPDEDLDAPSTFALLLAMTGGKGTFDAAIAPAGEDVVVTHPDHAPLFAHLDPGEGVTLRLAPGAVVSGRTLGRDGAPRGGVGVLLEGPVSRRGASGPDGSFSFKGLLPGSYHLKRHDLPPTDAGVEASVGDRGETSIDLKAP
jgi:hypothetical protein